MLIKSLNTKKHINHLICIPTMPSRHMIITLTPQYFGYFWDALKVCDILGRLSKGFCGILVGFLWEILFIGFTLMTACKLARALALPLPTETAPSFPLSPAFFPQQPIKALQPVPQGIERWTCLDVSSVLGLPSHSEDVRAALDTDRTDYHSSLAYLFLLNFTPTSFAYLHKYCRVGVKS